jgi:hypothetical protein
VSTFAPTAANKRVSENWVNRKPDFREDLFWVARE